MGDQNQHGDGQGSSQGSTVELLPRKDKNLRHLILRNYYVQVYVTYLKFIIFMFDWFINRTLEERSSSHL